MRWEGYIARMGNLEIHKEFYSGSLKEKDQLENLDVGDSCY
jgi:hypothetical protein